MKNGLAYKIQFENVELKMVTVLIFDTDVQIEDTADVTYVELQGAGDPLHISTTDNDEDKFTAIKSKSATIKFNSDSSYGLSTFSSGPDDRFYIEIDIEGQIIFYGYLLLDGNSEPFLPPTNEVTLTATDKLGSLKDVDLSEDDDSLVNGYYKLGELIGLCLKKTGLELPIKVINNLRHGSGQLVTDVTFATSDNKFILPLNDFFYPGQVIQITGTTYNDGVYVVREDIVALVSAVFLQGTSLVDEVASGILFEDLSSSKHLYDVVSLDARTFEEEIGQSEDCYTVLEKILGEDCCVTQWQGEWWIMRVDEFDGNPLYVANFDKDGQYLSTDAGTSFNKTIGYTEPLYLSQEATIVSHQRELGFIAETFNFNQPQEIICNVDFNRGTGAAPTPGALTETIDLDPDCWTFYREGDSGTNADLDQPPGVDSIGVLRKLYENEYEKERYLVTQTSAFRHYFKSTAMEVGSQDKLSISVDTRLATNTAVTNMYPVHVRLVGEDGTLWDWEYDSHEGINRWVSVSISTGWFSNPWRINRSGEDTTEWHTVSSTSPPVPVAGKIYIRLVDGFVAPTQVWFANLSVNYTPFINGSYQQFSAQESKIERTATQYSGVKQVGYLARREEEVFISDSPKKLLKGSLFVPGAGASLYSGSIQFGGTGFVLAGDVTKTYPAGNLVFIVSPSNTGFYRITSSTYNIIGSTTAVVLDQPVSTGTETGIIYYADYFLTTHFFTASVFGNSFPPSPDYCHPYGYIQAFSVWNQFRNANKIFDYTLQGEKDLDGFGTLPPDILNKYLITDTSQHSQDRYFMLLTYDHDLLLCESKGVLTEVYNAVQGKLYGDIFQFKYKTEIN